jgi:gamma-glutamylcysteine synthetase
LEKHKMEIPIVFWEQYKYMWQSKWRWHWKINLHMTLEDINVERFKWVIIYLKAKSPLVKPQHYEKLCLQRPHCPATKVLKPL